MKKLSETYKELGIAFSFPIKIRDADGCDTYRENSDGFWCRYERDANGKTTYFENSNDYWDRFEYDAKGNVTYYENSNGFWCKRECDANGNVTYREDSNGYKKGTPRSAKTCDGKVVESGEIKYKLRAL
jgi:hypothetical protein